MSSVGFSGTGPGETELPVLDGDVRQRLLEARVLAGNERRIAVAEVVARYPKHSLPWAELGDAADDVIGSYAAYRVGYHRGLDALRANGWRGSGYVRWVHEGNRGFLRCLEGLMKTASLINESDEAQRCRTFLAQLDPQTFGGLLE